MPLVSSLLATAAVSLVSVIGVALIILRLERREVVIKAMLAFAAGTLLGDAFFHLLPESFEISSAGQVAAAVLAGVMFGLVLELVLHQHHKVVNERGDRKLSAAYLNLVSDAIHNFLDGAAIAASFIVAPAVGLATTTAIIFHEIPQELADALILINAGWSNRKVILANLLVALTAMLGAILAFSIVESVSGLEPILIPFAAGQFIYIACADLLPEILHVERSPQHILNLVLFVIGVAIMLSLTLLEV